MNQRKKWFAGSGLCIVIILMLHTVTLFAQSNYSNLEQQAIEADEMGNLQRAINLSHQMLDVAARDFGKSSEEYRVVLYNLGRFYQEVHDYQKSLNFYNKAADQYRVIYDQPPEMPDGGFPPNRRRFYRYEDSLLGLAKTYTEMGDFQKAEELYRKVLKLSENRTWDVIYWEHLEATADFYIDMDNYAEGMRYYQEVLDQVAHHHRKDSYRYVERLVSIAYVYHNISQYEKAKEFFEQAKTFFESEDYDGETNASIFPTDYISTLQGLGLVTQYLDTYSKAIAYYDQMISFITNHYNANSFFLSYAYINKAVAFEELGKYDSQIRLLNKGLNVLDDNVDDPNHNLYRNYYNSLGRAYGYKENYQKSAEYLEKAVDIARNNFGTQSYEYGGSLYSLAVTYQNLDREDEAWDLFLESVDINFKYLKTNFTTLTSEERKSFWNTFKTDFENIQYQVIDTYKEKPTYIGTGYNYLLKSKAFLLQNTTGFYRAVSRNNDPAVQSDFNEWRTLRSKIAGSVNLSPSEQSSRGINVDELREEARRIEQSIAKEINFSTSVAKEPATWRDIQSELEEGEAAVEITRARQYSDEKRAFVNVHYAAYLLTDSGQPKLIELPDGQELEDRYVSQYRNAVQSQTSYDEAYNVFWKPIEQSLENITTVYFSPDGVFHQLSLNALRNPETGHYVLDNYDIRMVTKTSDIVSEESVSGQRGEDNAVLFGRPQYNTDQNTSGTVNTEFASSTGTISRSGLSNAEWTDLPGTEKEVKKISSMLRQEGWSIDTYLHQSATESQIKKLTSPRVLHIATHGFFTSKEGITSGFTRGLKIKDENSEENSSKETESLNPMMQSGLVFSGVQDFFGSSGSIQTEDGILTAFEASGLLLNDTELVVLSACETGLGEVSNGEGIYGLKRAFKIAGAESVIMSLWKVDDQATQEFMTTFYNNWLHSQNKRQAFADTQHQIREIYSSPYYWGAFVMVGS